MRRREFLGAATAGLAWSAWGRANSKTKPAKLSRISIMTYSFARVLKLQGQPESPDHTLELFDVPEMFADRYGVHNIELQHSHLITDTSYLTDFRARAAKVKSRITQINLEFGQATFSAQDEMQRNKAVALTKEWIDHAVTLGAGLVMLNQGQLTLDNKQYSIPTLKIIGDYGRSKGIRVSMETRAPAPNGRSMRRQRPGVNATYPPLVLPPEPAWVKDDATRVAWKNAIPFVMPPPGGIPAPVVPPAWAPDGANELLLENIKATGTYLNVDVGGMCVETQDQMQDHLRSVMPLESGKMHINWRDNPGWDLPTTIAYTKKIGYQGTYTIEVEIPNAGDPYLITQGLLETIVANI